MEFVRRCGVKFRSPDFRELGWKQGPDPICRKHLAVQRGCGETEPRSVYLGFARPALLDEALACCCILLWAASRRYDAQWIGGVETASIPIVAGMLAVNRAVGVEPLNGLFCARNGSPMACDRRWKVCPRLGARACCWSTTSLTRQSEEAACDLLPRQRAATGCSSWLSTPAPRQQILRAHLPGGRNLYAQRCAGRFCRDRDELQPDREKEDARADCAARSLGRADHSAAVDERRTRETAPTEMSAEDIELVGLAASASPRSAGKVRPALRRLRGSSGYMRFLGRYMTRTVSANLNAD